MPVAKVYVPEGILTPDQRREIVKGIHDVIVGLGRHRQRLCAPDLTIGNYRHLHPAFFVKRAASRMRAGHD